MCKLLIMLIMMIMMIILIIICKLKNKIIFKKLKFLKSKKDKKRIQTTK